MWHGSMREAVEVFMLRHPRLARAHGDFLSWLIENEDRLRMLRRNILGPGATYVIYTPSRFGHSAVIACIISRNGIKVVRTSYAYVLRYKHTECWRAN